MARGRAPAPGRVSPRSGSAAPTPTSSSKKPPPAARARPRPPRHRRPGRSRLRWLVGALGRVRQSADGAARPRPTACGSADRPTRPCRHRARPWRPPGRRSSTARSSSAPDTRRGLDALAAETTRRPWSGARSTRAVGVPVHRAGQPAAGHGPRTVRRLPGVRRGLRRGVRCSPSSTAGSASAPLRDVVFAADGERGAAGPYRYAQTGPVRARGGPVRLLRSWGSGPTSSPGHSIGELAAAHVAGVFACRTRHARRRPGAADAGPAGGRRDGRGRGHRGRGCRCYRHGRRASPRSTARRRWSSPGRGRGRATRRTTSSPRAAGPSG